MKKLQKIMDDKKSESGVYAKFTNMAYVSLPDKLVAVDNMAIFRALNEAYNLGFKDGHKSRAKRARKNV